LRVQRGEPAQPLPATVATVVPLAPEPEPGLAERRDEHEFPRLQE
jgi:HemY protein